MNEIDECILASCRTRLKVERVITDARVKAGMADGDESYEEIAGRLKGLVAAGQLKAAGNLDNWRFSEVRLKG